MVSFNKMVYKFFTNLLFCEFFFHKNVLFEILSLSSFVYLKIKSKMSSTLGPPVTRTLANQFRSTFVYGTFNN